MMLHESIIFMYLRIYIYDIYLYIYIWPRSAIVTIELHVNALPY